MATTLLVVRLRAGRRRCSLPVLPGRQARQIHLGGRLDLVDQIDRHIPDTVSRARLAHDLDRAGIQRLESENSALLRQRGDDDHRDRVVVHELPQEGDAIHAGHLHV
jgi:hypothetical protein